MTRYYYAGAERIAMRSGTGSGTAGLVWIVGDHLGSTAFTVNAATGLKQSERRYKPWGEARYTEGETGTKYGFTGQMAEVNKLYFYGSRFYDSYTGRWTQPDSLIPDPFNSLDWDRYQYVRSNPLKYIDPSGHRVAECGYYDCEKGPSAPNWFDELTEEGKENYYDYYRLNSKKGWWNNYQPGTMTPEQFLGLMMLHEANAKGITIEQWLQGTTKYHMWMEGVKGSPPLCYGTTNCDKAGIFNFMGQFMDKSGGPTAPKGLRGAVTDRVDLLLDYPNIMPGALSNYSSWSEIMERAAQLGRFVTTYDPKYVPYDGNAPYIWGNDPILARKLSRRPRGGGTNEVWFVYNTFFICSLNNSYLTDC